MARRGAARAAMWAGLPIMGDISVRLFQRAHFGALGIGLLFSMTGLGQCAVPVGQGVSTDGKHMGFVILHALSQLPMLWLFRAPTLYSVLWMIGLCLCFTTQNLLRLLQVQYEISPSIIVDK